MKDILETVNVFCNMAISHIKEGLTTIEFEKQAISGFYEGLKKYDQPELNSFIDYVKQWSNIYLENVCKGIKENEKEM